MPPQDPNFTPLPSPFVVRIVRERQNVGTRITPGAGSGDEIARVDVVGSVPADLVTDAAHMLGALAVEILAGAQSFWPVATGLSKSSFYYTVDDSGAVIRNYQYYARYVEERSQPAQRTLINHRSGMSAALRRFVRERFVFGA